MLLYSSSTLSKIFFFEHGKLKFTHKVTKNQKITDPWSVFMPAYLKSKFFKCIYYIHNFSICQ